MTQAMHQVLVIEDDAGIRDVLRALLQAANYRVVEAATAQRGDIEARSHKPDLLLVDLGLPDLDGVEVIRRVRAWSAVPIIVLSARSAEAQKLTAFDAGADDYVTKPFSAPELLARVRVALRRAATMDEGGAQLRLGSIDVDLARRVIRGAAEGVHLTPLEFRVLDVLARHPGAIVKQDKLMREAWGPGQGSDTRALRVCIRNLRQKLEPDPSRPRFLTTEVGLGYRLLSDEAPED
jgi:two-component system, OmpR family, KDP operon response regulator KdpE